MQVNNRYYIPQKTLIEKTVYSYDIYENRVIVGFLNKMSSDIASMTVDVKRLLNRQRTSVNTQSDYVHSSYFIFQRTEKTLQDALIKLTRLKREFEIIHNLYKRTLNIEDEDIVRMPHPTAIFRSVAQYNNIYNHIHRWFEYGIYDLNHERFMMSFISGTALYEVYVLAKLLEAISSLGLEIDEEYKYFYRIFSNSYYKNTLCNNTFIFKGAREKLVLYYQPVVYNSDYKAANGINLYRNNSLSRDGRGSYYYTPDYVIKYEKEGEEKYIIIDAKYGDRSFVREKQVSNLSFKYLFSISPREVSRVEGLYVLYGKANKHDVYETIYDKQLSGYEITPKFDIAPISASVNSEKHMAVLSKIISDVIMQ